MVLKLIAADPANKEAYYTLGVFDWGIAYAPIRDASRPSAPLPRCARCPTPRCARTCVGNSRPTSKRASACFNIALEKDPHSSTRWLIST